MPNEDDAYAAVLVKPRTIELRSYPVPEVHDNDALLVVEGTGICGSDWAPYSGDSPFPLPPVVLGHEVVGRIADIGSSAASRWNIAAGDRIVVEETIPCGFCDLCRSGNYPMCDGLHGTPGSRYGMVDVNKAPHLWGGYGNYMYLHPNSVVHRIADDIPIEIAPLFIPISNGIRWVQHIGRVACGETVFVQGPGQHGLGCVVAAKQAGAGCVIVAGTSRDVERLDVAKKLGADYIVLADESDVRGYVQDITNGRMCEVVVDATAGAPQAAQTVLDVAALRARVLIAGFREMRPLENFILDTAVMKGLTIIGAWGHEMSSVRSALKLIESGTYPLHLMCTHTFGLDEVDAALETIGGERKDSPIHVTILPNLD